MDQPNANSAIEIGPLPLARSSGNRQPAGPALVLLNVIRENPRVVLLAVRKARARDPGGLAAIERQDSSRAPPGFGNRRPPRKPRGPRVR
jgi:hypothetical protein